MRKKIISQMLTQRMTMQIGRVCLIQTVLTLTAESKVNGPPGFLLQHIPASILGSIISIADIASNRPNNFW